VLARAIAARSKPRFIEIRPEPRRKLTREFIEIPRAQRGRVPFTEEELTAFVAVRRLSPGEAAASGFGLATWRVSWRGTPLISFSPPCIQEPRF
jgi:hypothetical protein